jgi:hypothetical protein
MAASACACLSSLAPIWACTSLNARRESSIPVGVPAVPTWGVQYKAGQYTIRHRGTGVAGCRLYQPVCVVTENRSQRERDNSRESNNSYDTHLSGGQGVGVRAQGRWYNRQWTEHMSRLQAG